MRISNDKLYGLLDSMLDGNYSSKNFINHLIHSYYSKDMVTTVKSVDGFFKCVLTNEDFNDKGRFNKSIAVTGLNTTTYMSKPAYDIFSDWLFLKTTESHPHVNWVLSNMRVTRKVDVSSKYSLGDVNGVLAKLKLKIELNER